MKTGAPSELTTEFLEKSSVMALEVNIDETASIHFFYPTAAIKPYQKEMLKTRPLTTFPLDFFGITASLRVPQLQTYRY